MGFEGFGLQGYKGLYKGFVELRTVGCRAAEAQSCHHAGLVEAEDDCGILADSESSCQAFVFFFFLLRALFFPATVSIPCRLWV